MSTRQLAYAAVNGRQVRFHFLRGDDHHVISGYIVGMDDYHVLVAEVTSTAGEPTGISTTLITKGRADYTSLDNESTLEQEPEVVRKAVDDVGGAFFRFCKEHYFGQKPPSQPEEPAR